MTYQQVRTKRSIEEILMFPFVLAGRIAGRLFPLKTRHRVFLFFPNGDIGGSPQVNIDLTHCIAGSKPLIIFSKKPNNNQFRDKYNIAGVRVIDLHRYIDNKWLHFINFFFRGVIASWVSKEPTATVFGGECIFFYKVVPHLPRRVHCVELSHLATWLPYSIAFADRINLRVFSTEKLKQSVEAQYRENNLPEAYFSRLVFIDNAIDIPPYTENQHATLQVYFIGRGAAQKRVHLVAAVAEQLHTLALPVLVNFVGDVEKVINPAQYPYCRFYGNISDQQKMMQVYRDADVLLLTSSFEGLPIVVMQMMAHGKTVVSTAVNGIPDYIFHEENGLLIYATDEKEIVAEAVSHIIRLLKDKELQRSLGKRSREIAMQKFSREVFCREYGRMLGI